MGNNIILDLRYTITETNKKEPLFYEVSLERDEDNLDIDTIALSSFYELTKYFLKNGVDADVLHRAIKTAEYVHGLKLCREEESRGQENGK